MNLAGIKRVRAAVEGGVWYTVEDTVGMEGVKLKVRGYGNSDYSRMYGDLAAAMPADKRDDAGVPVASERAAIVAECLKRTCLVGWNLDDEFSPAAVDAAFADPDMGETWLNVVRYAAWRIAEDARKERDTAAKN